MLFQGRVCTAGRLWWRGAYAAKPRLCPLKEEHCRRAAREACNRARSRLTRWVTVVEAAYPKPCKAFKTIESDQLGFLG